MTNDSETCDWMAKQDALAHALRVASANFIASTLAHDLSQPLTAINAWASACLRLARGEDIEREKLIERLTLLQRESWRATEMIREFRSNLGRREPVLGAVDVNRLLGGLCTTFSVKAHAHGIELRADLQEDLPPAQGDAGLIELAAYILICNSFDALGRGGAKDQKITIRSRRSAAAMVEVVVADNGPGLDTESGEALFRPFSGRKAGGMGMGIGLAVCRNAVESLGGRVWLEQGSGSGATFVVAVPCATDGGGYGRAEPNG